MPWVYFPLRGVISMVAQVDSAPESIVEVATVGNEGMVGLPIFLGADLTPGYAFAQVAGTALRMPADALRSETAQAGALSKVLHRYTQALLVQVYQGTTVPIPCRSAAPAGSCRRRIAWDPTSSISPNRSSPRCSGNRSPR
jgi:hypothetical protein